MASQIGLKEAALHYHSLGWRVFPLIPNGKVPFNKGSEGYVLSQRAKKRKLTRKEISDMWDSEPEANIGLYPGTHSGVSIIDLDIKEAEGINGIKTLQRNDLQNVLDAGLLVSTPSGGTHLYFGATKHLPQYFNSGNFTKDERGQYGIDIRNSTKGHAVLPPSKTDGRPGTSKGSYRFVGALDLPLARSTPSEPTELTKAMLPRFPYTGLWFVNLPKKTKHFDAGHWTPKRKIKEAAPLYEAWDLMRWQALEVRKETNVDADGSVASDGPGASFLDSQGYDGGGMNIQKEPKPDPYQPVKPKPIRKQDEKRLIDKHCSRLKGLPYLTIIDDRGTVFGKTPEDLDIYYPVVFSQFVTGDDLTDDEYDCIYGSGSKLQGGSRATFPDGRHRMLMWSWKTREWRWYLLNDRRPYTWDIIHHAYL
jgi:hypothetical protein